MSGGTLNVIVRMSGGTLNVIVRMSGDTLNVMANSVFYHTKDTLAICLLIDIPVFYGVTCI